MCHTTLHVFILHLEKLEHYNFSAKILGAPSLRQFSGIFPVKGDGEEGIFLGNSRQFTFIFYYDTKPSDFINLVKNHANKITASTEI